VWLTDRPSDRRTQSVCQTTDRQTGNFHQTDRPQQAVCVYIALWHTNASCTVHLYVHLPAKIAPWIYNHQSSIPTLCLVSVLTCRTFNSMSSYMPEWIRSFAYLYLEPLPCNPSHILTAALLFPLEVLVGLQAPCYLYRSLFRHVHLPRALVTALTLLLLPPPKPHQTTKRMLHNAKLILIGRISSTKQWLMRGLVT